MIRIFGTMTDPSGSPVPGAIIELRAISSTNEVLLGSTVNHKCDQQGAYSFQLAAGMYDAYAQNDRCGDMDYLGTAKVSANSADGDLHSILVDGGININPPMLEAALAAAQRAEQAATSATINKEGTSRDAEATKRDAESASSSAQQATQSANTATSAKESIVADAQSVRSLADQVSAQSFTVAEKHGEVLSRSELVSTQAGAVATQHQEVLAKASLVSANTQTVLESTSMAVAAADTATQKAALSAGHEAVSLDAATRAEAAASAVVGTILDGGECDLSNGVYPAPITVSGKPYSSIWYVAVAGVLSGISFDVGDMLRYTTAKGGYYFKVDAKDEVYSVNGEKGAVQVTPEKIGAERIGVAQQLVDQHSSKAGAHPISGVEGLAEALAGKYSPTNKPKASDIGAYDVFRWSTGGVTKEWLHLVSAAADVGMNAQDISLEITGGNGYGGNTSPVCLLKINLRGWVTSTDPSLSGGVTLTSINGEVPEYRIVVKLHADKLNVFMERPGYSNVLSIQVRNMLQGEFIGGAGYDPGGFVVAPRIVAFR